jgi:hypothetical protein
VTLFLFCVDLQVGVSQALLDVFVSEVLPRFKHPIVLVTSDYNSDRSAPKPFGTDHSHLLDDRRIAHWISDNWHAPRAAINPPTRPTLWCTDGGSKRLRLHRFSDDPAGYPAAAGDGGLPHERAAGSCAAHPKLTLAPIGINDRHVKGSHGDRALLLAAARALPPSVLRPPIARANFHFSRRLGWWGEPASGHCCDRAAAFAALAPKSLAASLLAPNSSVAATVGDGGALAIALVMTGVDSGTPSHGDDNGDMDHGSDIDSDIDIDSSTGSGSEAVHFIATSQTVAEAWAGLRGFAFDVSPEGNGVDAHRTWEALVLNTIPIVR